MDLETAKLNETRASTLARLSMVACFAAASFMLLASLNLAQGSSKGTASRSSHNSDYSVP